MSSSPLPSRLARGYAALRGTMLLVFSGVYFFAPELALHGSSNDLARHLSLMVASRTALLGGALVLLAARRRAGLAWVLLADAALQVFDTGLALATHQGAVAGAPAVLGALDAWAGVVLLRSSRASTLH